MHEFLPVLKQTISGPKKRFKCAFQKGFNRVKAQLPWQLQPFLSHGATLPKDRIRRGPFITNGLWPKYLLWLREPRKNNVNSVERSRAFANPNRVRLNKMKCWWQFVSTPTADTPGTLLLLHFDSRRFLIGNVAEGAQRICLQRKIGLNKLGDIFLTGKIGWPTMGGLLGMMLTTADSQSTSLEERKQMYAQKGKTWTQQESWLNLHGGYNLTHVLGTARRFVFRQGLPMYTQEFRLGEQEEADVEKPTWRDDLVKVWAVVTGQESSPTRKRSHDEYEDDAVGSTDKDFLEGRKDEEEERRDQIRKGVVAHMFGSEWRLDALVERPLSEVKQPATIFFRNEKGNIEKYEGLLPEEDPVVGHIKVLVRNPWPGAMIENLPSTTPSKSSVSYIFKNYEQRGRFLRDKAVQLGVKPGKDFGVLTGGNSVTAQDGSTVHPHQVMEPAKEGSGLVVVDIPDASYIEPLLARSEWSNKSLMNGVEVMVWILGPGVVNDARVQDFMKNHNELRHIVSAQDCCANNLAFESAATAAIRLNILDRDRFPIPAYSNGMSTEQITDRLYEVARPGLTAQLEPKFILEKDKIVPYLDTIKVVEESSSEVAELADAARKEMESSEYQAELDERQKDLLCKDAEAITLGTGSALPSKYRNVSGTLLRVPVYGNYLFDCGEGTLGQMKRIFGNDIGKELRKLRTIWISHLHADHHLGTVSLIKAWHEETSKYPETASSTLVIASDDAMLQFLLEYSQVEDIGYARLVPMSLRTRTRTTRPFTSKETFLFGLKSIAACAVSHCHNALAVVLTFPNGFKVAYSGDCRPSTVFSEIGQGATLLIHEATFDDELAGDAEAKKHCTTSEALEVARKMGARRIILTHFSQRYQKIPLMDHKDDGKSDQVAVVAFDYMRVKVGDIAKLEGFRPALLKLYEDATVEMGAEGIGLKGKTEVETNLVHGFVK